MGKQENIEETIQILESIIERANLIQGNPDRELCLDIDLMLEDLRLLYRRYEVLKKQCESEHAEEKEPPGAGRRSFVAKPKDNERHEANRVGTNTTRSEDGPAVPSFFTETESETESASISKEDTASKGGIASPAPSAGPVPQSATENPDQTTSAPVAHHRAEPSQPQPSQPQPPQPETRRPDPSPMDTSPSQSGYKQDMASQFVDYKSDTQSEKPPVNVKSEGSGADTTTKGNNGKSVIDLFSQSPSRSIGDRFGNDDKSLHQRISSQKEDRSIGTRLQQHPITNIKDAIGLNEKFLFINELFQGDIQAYNDALTRLNSMGSLKEAFEFLNNLTNIHKWDANRSAETVEKLAGFVQRRYLDK